MVQLVTQIPNHQELEKKIKNENLSFAESRTNSTAMYLASSDYESYIEAIARRQSVWNNQNKKLKEVLRNNEYQTFDNSPVW